MINFTQGLTTTAEFLGSGAGVYLLTALAKKVSFIPISEGQTARIRAFAGFLSLVGTVLIGVANKNVGSQDLQHLFVSGIGLALSWMTAHTVHQVVSTKSDSLKQ